MLAVAGGPRVQVAGSTPGEHSRRSAGWLRGSEVSTEKSRKGSRSVSQMPVLGLASQVGDSDLCGRGAGGAVCLGLHQTTLDKDGGS